MPLLCAGTLSLMLLVACSISHASVILHQAPQHGKKGKIMSVLLVETEWVHTSTWLFTVPGDFGPLSISFLLILLTPFPKY